MGREPTPARRSPSLGTAACALVSACLAGVSGLALQSLIVGAAGLALGYGASLALGLALWLSAWAAGAAWARDPRVGSARGLLLCGVALLLLAPSSMRAVLFAGERELPGVLTLALPIAALTVPACLQGVFLPALARTGAQVGGLFAANLAGCVAGAWLVADQASGALGRVPAAWIAGLAALLAGLAGAAARRARVAALPFARPNAPSLTPRRAFLLVVFGTAWMSALEWVCLRLGVLWFGGMQNALSAVLCGSLVALAFGALVLPPLCAGRRSGFFVLLALAVLGSLWPFAASAALHASRDAPLWTRALILCVPALFAFGGFVPIVHAAVDDVTDAGGRLGRLLSGEVFGAVLGIPLVHWFVVPHLGLSGALAAALVFGALAALALGRRAWVPVVCVAVLVARAPTPARASEPYANPAFTVVSLEEDRDFTVAVVDDGLLGERTLLTDGFRAAGTGRDYLYMQALGHLPILLHPAPHRVAVLALGTGTTVGAVSLHDEVQRIDVLELSRAVVATAPAFVEKNHGALAEGLPGLTDPEDGVARVVVRLGDGRATLAAQPANYDVITMEPLLPDSPLAVYLYTPEFYAIARRALLPGGLVCQWVPPHALEPTTFDAVCAAFGASFPWSGAWVFGTQVVLVGGERAPRADEARSRAGSPVLRAELERLGLSTAADLASRLVGPGLRAADAARALRDDDPWIVHRPRRRGRQLLLDLPTNLERLESAPADVAAILGHDPLPDEQRRLDGQRALRAARIAAADRAAELRGARRERSRSADLEARLTAARSLQVGDPDLARFVLETEFLDAQWSGLAALAASPARDAAELALEPLVRAAELRRERADVHLHVAIALERLGSQAAQKALDEALARCPRLAETAEGESARRLGISADSWERMLESARTRR